MPLQTPILDDRTFQDIVDEAKKRIPHYCPEWTDHNVSDPGVTLIELFALMTENLLYRLNQVPELHYIKFMEMLGVKLEEPKPARTYITFWLTAPQPNPLVIRAGTEVSSIQTETEDPIVFSTDRDLHIEPPQLTVLAINDEQRPLPIQENKGIEIFPSPEKQNDALYFGFSNNLSHHILRFHAKFTKAGGGGVNPESPPYRWEVSSGDEEHPWIECEAPEFDTTNALNQSGQIQLHLPQMSRNEHCGENLYWVRLHVIDSDYYQSPRLKNITAVETWGAAASATHAELVREEVLGYSDGTPGQCFYLQNTPVMERRKEDRLWAEPPDRESVPWTEVPHFADSGPTDNHYTVDGVTGEIRLGPAVRLPTGEIRQFGRTPPFHTKLTFRSYRHGGGTKGNVESLRLDTLRSSIPFVSRVANRKPAQGGLDRELLESAMLRTPKLLRTRERAVTTEDYEFLAQTLLPNRVGRTKCLATPEDQGPDASPGEVTLLIIPPVPHAEGYIAPSQLQAHPADLEILHRELDKRRLLTTRLRIKAPQYVWVAVSVRFHTMPGVEQKAVRDDALRALYQYINPLVGGPNRTGWPFGQRLLPVDIYQCLQGIVGDAVIESVALYEADEKTGQVVGTALTAIDAPTYAVLASGFHTVEFV